MSFPRRMPQVSMSLLVLLRAARENWCDKSQGMRSFRMCPFDESSVVEAVLDSSRTSSSASRL